ncbi:hypothetical protein PR003_g22726 [Phytophthora rubi]|uniref:Uncharacterized protein n=1 Tax=Phytophthora rubi TaxID=129364 RepID=A0A6A3J6P0_9STRA|nr:hypothetical protein PR001_g21361 [Phytophthora rubi]KAE9300571.1 hypothetical protein PR003_g22726 [Phytophthora rubi]
MSIPAPACAASLLASPPTKTRVWWCAHTGRSSSAWRDQVAPIHWRNTRVSRLLTGSSRRSSGTV